MIEFTIAKKSKNSRARIGFLKTLHGEVQTPCLVPVATQGVVKTLEGKEVTATGSTLLICNTYHLHLKPGERIIQKAGGLHRFINWPGLLMTDSGGFQVFSLGFGRDMGMSKILKEKRAASVTKIQQPKNIKITEEGVLFRSPIDGKNIFLSPEKSIKIQEQLGADIMFAFDECPPPNASQEYLKKSLELTHRWAKRSLRARKNDQALYGIVQGGKYRALRKQSTQIISSMEFDGFGIGGEFGQRSMHKVLGWTISHLPSRKPRHLLGVGYLKDIRAIIEAGVDTFDCVVPTRFARHGVAFTSAGELDMRKSAFLKQRTALDRKCKCSVCQQYTRSYISHLVRAREITGLKLLTFHNLYFFNDFIRKIREGI